MSWDPESPSFSRELDPLGLRLSSPGERERHNADGHKSGGQNVAVMFGLQLPPQRSLRSLLSLCRCDSFCMNLHMTIQHIKLIWCRKPDISVMVWLRTGFPRRRSDKQTKNNEESISEQLVQATKKRRKRNRPPQKEHQKKKGTKKETALCLIEKKKENRRTKQQQKKRRKKNVSRLRHSYNFYLSVNKLIWVRKKGFKLIIMVKTLVLMTGAFLEG